MNENCCHLQFVSDTGLNITKFWFRVVYVSLLVLIFCPFLLYDGNDLESIYLEGLEMSGLCQTIFNIECGFRVVGEYGLDRKYS